MARKHTNQVIRCQYYQWRLSDRNGVFQADGRGNKPDAGRHSLGTRDYETAIAKLRILDERVAAKLGRIRPELMRQAYTHELTLDEGVSRYFEHIGRPRVAKGAGASTVKRYRPVFKKALEFFKRQGITTWDQVTAARLTDYLAWLDGEQYAYGTEYFEGTVLKQALKYLVESKSLPNECRIVLHLDRPSGTDTYCYTDEEVAAMIHHCREIATLDWLGDAIVGLSHTGMRISELSQLTWSAIDMERKLVVIKDESRRSHIQGRTLRTNKGRRDRRFPIHPTLYEMLLRHSKKGIFGRVFKAAKGGALHDGNLRKIFVEQVLAPLAGRFPTPPGEIGFANGRLHSFRHYFCSWCANRSVPEQAVMDWLGHRDSAMVRHYYHLHDPQAQQQMLKLGTIPGLDVT
ncbi:MAG: tyrosine-type recombinase/integrase [Planctomycetaceae bacterium]|nr:tyrosine-type recombinase/integrase [Planctomycetaceae bacterium]